MGVGKAREGKWNKLLPPTTVLLLTPSSLLVSCVTAPGFVFASGAGMLCPPPVLHPRGSQPNRASPPAVAGAKAVLLY